MSDGARVTRAAARGAVAAMAMTGMRVLTVELSVVERTPPEVLARQKARGLLRKVPRRRRRAAIELAHWTYGALGGAAFGTLPEALRTHRWAGPAYGLAVWLGFELGISPVLGLARADRLPVAELAALAADHVLYGVVVSGSLRPPEE